MKKPTKTRKADAHLLILDAHALAYRAYYALEGHHLTHPETGQATQAIHGFFSMFFPLLLQYKAKYCAVVWDAPGPVFRQGLYSQYKASRRPMPEDLPSQIEEIKNILSKHFAFANLSVQGYEADDIIGTLTRFFAKKGKVYIVSSDKDCYQLLSPEVSMLRSAKGTSDFIEIDPPWLKQTLGIGVEQVRDYMGLVGDSSDDIPGVKGVGPKHAQKLLEQYHDLEGIYANLRGVQPKSVQKNLAEYKEEAFLSRKLATIEQELPEILHMLKENQEALAMPDFLSKERLDILQQEGYLQVYKTLKKIQNPHEEEEPDDDSLQSFKKDEVRYTLIRTTKKLQWALKTIKRSAAHNHYILALDTESDALDTMEAKIIGISLCAKSHSAYYIPFVMEENALFSGEVLRYGEILPFLKDFLEDKKLRIVGQNLKFDYALLKKWGINLPMPYFDTMIASFLCNPLLRRHNLDDMARDILGYQCISYSELAGTGSKQKNLAEMPPEEISDYACEDADIAFRLYAPLQEKLEDYQLKEVFHTIEMPLVPVLQGMEEAGIAIDEEYFYKLARDYNEKLSELQKQIYQLAGYSFNIQSTRELQKVLFEELQLPKGKKTKTGYSTNQEVLENLRDHHPLVERILEHRKYGKLLSTYVEALPPMLNKKTGRLHSNFHQCIASTGRLSSMKPNLQNIPIREETGRAIRRGFIARKGNVLLSFDYSQIELRIMAHYSQDKALMEAFTKQEQDIHAATAASLFGVAPEEVTGDMRNHGKIVNFSIIYGVTEFGLARNLKSTREEAALYIERFFTKYPGVRRYMDESIAFAQKHSYVQSLSGRIRQIPDIHDKNSFLRAGAERVAINTPIQASSADIIKIAMISIDKELKAQKLRSHMVLQVHDELLFDVFPEEEEKLTKVVSQRMEGAAQLRVPLVVEKGRGYNWDEAH